MQWQSVSETNRDTFWCLELAANGLLVSILWSASPEKRGDRQRVICAIEKRQEVEQVGVVTEEVPAKGLCGESCLKEKNKLDNPDGCFFEFIVNGCI